MSLRHAVLGLLVDRSGSGYDLMKLFDTSLGNVWPATQSQLYGELNRLDAAGLIEVVAEGPRGRKEYALTEEGGKELRRWLEEEGEKPQRNEMLLQVFFLGVLPKRQQVAILLEQAELAARQHAALTGIEQSLDREEDGMLTFGGRLALEYGLRLRAMEEEWARWAAAQVLDAGDTGRQGTTDGEAAGQ